MENSDNIFFINKGVRIFLWLRPALKMVIIAILLSVYFDDDPYIALTDYGGIILIGLSIWVVLDLVKVFKWNSYKINLLEEGIWVQKEYSDWGQIESFDMYEGSGFKTLIGLTLDDGKILTIPYCIENPGFVQSYIENRVPDHAHAEE